jgi:hypothetical protein
MSCQNACPDGNILNCIKNNLTKCPDCKQFNPTNCTKCLKANCSSSCSKLNWNECSSCMSAQVTNCPTNNLNNFFNCIESKCPSCDITDCDNCLKTNIPKCQSCDITIGKCSKCLENKCREYGPVEYCSVCGVINEIFPNFCNNFSSEKGCSSTDFGNLGCCNWVDNKPTPSPNDSTGSIVGIIIGSLVTLGLLGIILYYALRKRKRKSKHKR